MRAVRLHEHGGVEVLRYEEASLPIPGPREARIRIEAIGLNFLDVYHRTGLYKVALPFIPGSEAAGSVDAVGDEVTEVRPGDRVGYASQPGAYAEYAVVPAWKVVPLPGGIDARTAAAALLQGMTAEYLTHSTYPLRAGETALVHAAAGGVGLWLVQVIKRLGATVYGTVSTEAKAALAREAGADAVIRYMQEDVAARVRQLTGGRGVDVVYDSVGRDTIEGSLNSLRPRGYLVLFGQSSGAAPPVDPLTLLNKGSLFLTRPTLAHYTATREELLERAGAVFRWVLEGAVRVRIDRTFALADVAEAHNALEARVIAGKALLIP